MERLGIGLEQAKIDRINELAGKAREGALSEEETAERAALRLEYVAAYKQSLVAQLENTYVVDENGEKRKLRHREE